MFDFISYLWPQSMMALAARCTVNGVDTACPEGLEWLAGFGIGLMIFVFVVGILATIFWIMMLVHAATKPIENRAVWIIVLVFTGILGAIIYYFVVKRKTP